MTRATCAPLMAMTWKMPASRYSFSSSGESSSRSPVISATTTPRVSSPRAPSADSSRVVAMVLARDTHACDRELWGFSFDEKSALHRGGQVELFPFRSSAGRRRRRRFRTTRARRAVPRTPPDRPRRDPGASAGARPRRARGDRLRLGRQRGERAASRCRR